MYKIKKFVANWSKQIKPKIIDYIIVAMNQSGNNMTTFLNQSVTNIHPSILQKCLCSQEGWSISQKGLIFLIKFSSLFINIIHIQCQFSSYNKDVAIGLYCLRLYCVLRIRGCFHLDLSVEHYG